MKFYISALVGVIIKVILQNARCNNKDCVPMFKLYSLSKSMCIRSRPDDSQINESVNGCAVESVLQVGEQIKRL